MMALIKFADHLSNGGWATSSLNGMPCVYIATGQCCYCYRSVEILKVLAPRND